MADMLSETLQYRLTPCIVGMLCTVVLTGCPNRLPTASFTGAPRTGPAPVTVYFADTSDAGRAEIEAWAWTFGDGGTSASQHPTHTYQQPGTYTVSLTVATARGENTHTEPGYIVVNGAEGEGEGEGEVYYVDKNHASASDANPGTQAAPWATLEHAAETAGPGATVRIRAGVYNEQLFPQNSGTAGAPIVFTSHPGETAIIDGTGVSTSGNGVIIARDHIALRGLEVRSWDENAVWVEEAAYVEISDCEIHDAAFGVGFGFGSHDFQVIRVVAHHFDLYGFDVSPSGGDACYNGVFTDCVAHTGRDPEQNVDGFALGHGDQHDFTLLRCTAYDVYDGFDISSQDSTLDRCLAYNCLNGYKLWQDNVRLVNCIGYGAQGANVELDWDEEPGTVTLQNCTFFNAGTFGVWVENQGDSLHMYNCIVAGDDNIGLAFEQHNVSNYMGDYNLFHIDAGGRAIAVGYEDEFSLSEVASGAWNTYSGQDAHSVTATDAEAIFVNAATHDLDLAAGSPAIDAGTDTDAPALDYAGNGRPQGAGYDIGAYEYAGR